MYDRYFGFSEPPFSIAPDPRYLYMSEQHRDALAHLLFGIDHGGFVLLTGEVGTGKTTICRCLLEQLPAETDVAFIFNPKLTAEELLATICDEFRIAHPEGGNSIKRLIDRINAFLLNTYAEGRTAVLIIDEAQNLAAEVLEQMRLLTNLETNERKLLQVIMIGQPELRAILTQPHLRQLAQRITARYHLGPLRRCDVAAYVAHRLKVAGVERDLFPPAVIRRLHRVTGGIPRLINVIADRALLGAYVRGEHRITPAIIARAAAEVLDGPRPVLRHWWRAALAAGGATAAAVALIATVWGVPEGVRDALSGGSAPAGPAGGSVQAEQVAPLTAAKAQPSGAPLPAGSVEPAPVLIAHARISSTAPARNASDPADPAAAAPTLFWPREIPLTGSRALAFAALLARWGVDYQPGQGDPCAIVAADGLGCFEDTGTLATLRRLNQPAVLRLKDRQDQVFDATLIALGGNEAELLIAGKRVRTGLGELKARWLGSYALLWRLPPGYVQPVALGTEGTIVAWIAKRLAGAEGDHSPALHRVYDAAMRERVRRFQISNDLTPDGVVGPQTLLLLGGAGGSVPTLAPLL